MERALRITSEPPAALIASVAWVGADGQLTAINVWDAPDAVAEFYMERVSTFVQAEGEPPNKPQRHGRTPRRVFRR